MDEHCPDCGHSLKRDTRPMTLHYKGLSATFDMPGWYCKHCGESVHSGTDMQESDRQLNLLRERSRVSLHEDIEKGVPAGAKH